MTEATHSDDKPNGNGNGGAHASSDPLAQRIEEGPKGGAQTWYDVLEIAFDASASDVKKAYDRALALVEGRNIGGYLMLDPLAAESARADVEAAFSVLGDPERRAVYDQKLRDTGKAPNIAPATIPVVPASSLASTSAPAPAGKTDDAEARDAREMLAVADAQTSPSTPPTSGLPRTTSSSQLKFLAPAADESKTDARSDPLAAKDTSPSIRFEPPKTDHGTGEGTAVPEAQATAAAAPAEAPAAPVDPNALPDGEITGTFIQRLRESRGLSIEALAEATKIRKPYLRAIEEQDFPNLPARVYLRGFLTQVARVLKVDRGRLSEGYLQFVEKNGPKS